MTSEPQLELQQLPPEKRLEARLIAREIAAIQQEEKQLEESSGGSEDGKIPSYKKSRERREKVKVLKLSFDVPVEAYETLKERLASEIQSFYRNSEKGRIIYAAWQQREKEFEKLKAGRKPKLLQQYLEEQQGSTNENGG